MQRLLLILLVAFGAGGCQYVKTTTRQAVLASRQAIAPQQRSYKHMLGQDHYFVSGEVKVPRAHRDRPLVVIALSDAFRPGEIVDLNHTARDGSYYGLHLPSGDYLLCALSDLNRDGVFSSDEVFAQRQVTLSPDTAPEKVLGDCDLNTLLAPAPSTPFSAITVPVIPPREESFFYPKGSIRSLDDPIFAPQMASLGLYDPSGFLETAPMLFYALEEDLGYKIPVVFVHGIQGSARDFEAIVEGLDRKIYRPWFFHYPSGMSLDQLSSMFYRIFLSGRVIPLEETPLVIVAHSMGGLVVREALNHLEDREREAQVRALITIASPLGGHPAARLSQHGPVVLPSWRDIAPESAFIENLHRQKLPEELVYDLIFAYGSNNLVTFGKPSDGVVPLSSQCVPWAQEEATVQRGFDDSHTGILRNPEAIAYVIDCIEEVEPIFPPDHLAFFWQGGFHLPPNSDLSPLEAHMIENYGHWLEALTEGTITPFHPTQEHFIAVAQGRASPDNPIERAWLKFKKLEQR